MPFRPRIICAWEVGPVSSRHAAAWNSRSSVAVSWEPYRAQFVLCLKKNLFQLFNGTITIWRAESDLGESFNVEWGEILADL